MTIDYLIIGQGLAGSLLAWELINRQKKVIIVDNGKESASLIAAGLINPATGMRLVKTAEVDKLLPTAHNYYKQLSDYFQHTFYIENPMLRIIRNNEELLTCQKKLQETEYKNYLAGLISSTSNLVSPFGIVEQKKTGYLLTKTLLSALKNYFIAKQVYRHSEIIPSEIKFKPCLHWQNIQTKKIIFCEGHHATNNPWFSWLPFQPVKGEILTATAGQKIQQNILNYGHWFIPLDSHQFRTGATFDRESLNTQSTKKAKQSLLNSLKQVYPRLTTKHISRQQAGIRPATLDKQPFIGNHPKHPELVIFNGFGAKGSLQIPWYCQSLANNLLNNKAIPQPSNILRFKNNWNDE